MTGQCLLDVVAVDQRTDVHLDTDIDVRVTSKSLIAMLTSARVAFLNNDRTAQSFLGREAGADAPESRAQETHDT